ncbi:cytochrome c biogenesis protein CcdA [Lysobacter pythonis]|uniref:Cytochrome c biogenesis protein CcdA n=1 Tax=Solilutibacter pythonis TaxID=2483112 RepID=A0A3M2HPT0_9GAMM|nr:cytochrome c biogenesis protein CcdA [Lysobacter pythonis]RMH87744.1 cytochrome c biogenesis protein CcdA [Lysobacter pythonis]
MITFTELGLAWLAGSLTTLNPCVFPLLPLVLGGTLQANRWAPMAMGAGMVSMFAMLGLLVGMAGDALGIDQDLIRTAGAWLLISFGLVMLVPVMNEWFTRLITPLANGAHGATMRLDGGSLHGAFATGGLLGMVWSPCSGPMLASALAVVATEGGATRGTLILGMFGFGAASVLVAVAYASRQGIGKARGWVLSHMHRVKKIFGLMVLLVGIAILSGFDKWLEAQLIHVLPQGWIDLTTQF